MQQLNRRDFLTSTVGGLAAAGLGFGASHLPEQIAGERPARDETVEVLNPRMRVPLSFIIDDSTCLVNLNKKCRLNHRLHRRLHRRLGLFSSEPVGVDRVTSADLKLGRMVDVIERGEPAIMLAHWTGIYFNGEETGFKIFQETARRMHTRFDHLRWMKLTDIARYWAAKELTRVVRNGDRVTFTAPFACPDFTVRVPDTDAAIPTLKSGGRPLTLRSIKKVGQLKSGGWIREKSHVVACFNLPKGTSTLTLGRV